MVQAFIGREKELSTLNELYRKEGFQFAVVYGRRRVGKTTLLRKFAEGKEHIYFIADQSVSSLELVRFSREIFSYFKLHGFTPFHTWEDAFRFISQKAGNMRLVIIIDEFQYLAESERTLPSTLQRVIDTEWKDTNLFLILCGSYVSFMEREVLGARSPLYGRLTLHMEIGPLDFFDAQKFFKRYSPEERVLAYSVLGGTPQYLRTFTDEKDVLTNIKENILSKYSYLYDEPNFFLRQELREPRTYNAILCAIAQGNTKLNEIATKTRLDTSKVAKYLDVLEGLRIVKRAQPLAIGRHARGSVYEIRDNFFRFWYRFVFENRDLIEREMNDVVLEKYIKPFIENHTGKVFEEICIDFLAKLNVLGKLPFTFTKIGKWWGNNPVTRQEEEIDVIAYSDTCLLVGECKWSRAKVDVKVAKDLMKKSALFDFERKYHVLFSKSGFTERLRAFAKHNDFLLFELKDFENI